MLFHHLQGTNPGVDIEQFVGDLREVLDEQVFRVAWQRIADRHAILHDYRGGPASSVRAVEVHESITLPLTSRISLISGQRESGGAP